MDLTNQTQIQIQNQIFTLGSPVTHADTLDQLLGIFQQEGITGRPIVIINPVSDSLPDLPNLLENYIENAMQGVYTAQPVSYLFQDATDEDIIAWAKAQYNPAGDSSMDYLIEVGKTIREQSKLKRELDRVNARRDELWKQHCLNPNSNEGSDEYSNLTYTVVPQIEDKIKEVTAYLDTIPKSLNNGYVPEPVEEPIKVDVQEEPVSLTEPSSDPCVPQAPDIFTWCSTKLLMPLSIAKNLAQSPQNQAFKAQQEQTVEGYTTVPLEYLIALGISLYADGVPIVYTKSGTFRRVGNSAVSPVVNSYWYPKPRYH